MKRLCISIENTFSDFAELETEYFIKTGITLQVFYKLV